MKQTAVEWLEKICNDRGYILMSEYFELAKEMEKEQQGYSEEDMREAIKFGLNGMYGYQFDEEGETENQISKYFNTFKNK